jgi:hypothetical protein
MYQQKANVVLQPVNELKGTTEIKEESDPRGRHCARDWLSSRNEKHTYSLMGQDGEECSNDPSLRTNLSRP